MNLNKIAIFLVGISFICAAVYNEWNLAEMRASEIPLRENTTIITADDVSYLSPMKRLYEQGKIYTNETEKWTSIIRTPGYGLFYFGFLKLIGPNYALFALKWFQYLLFALSVGALFKLYCFWLENETLAFWGSLLYGIFPFSHGFLAHTLTEAITPALLIFSYFTLMKALKNPMQKWWWIVCMFIGGWLVLVRPVLGLLLLPILYFLFVEQRKNSLRLLFLFLLFSAPITFWQTRNKAVLGSFQSIHPIYQHQIHGMYRLPHQSFWNLVKSWEHKSENFHDLTRIIWSAAGRGDDPKSVADQVIRLLPEHVVASLGNAELREYLIDLQNVIMSVRLLELSEKPLPVEVEIAKKSDELKMKYRKLNWINYAILTPAKVFNELTIHSNLPYYTIQGKYRGKWWTETLRVVSLGLHSLLFLSLIIVPFFFTVYCNKHFRLFKECHRFRMWALMIMAAVVYLSFLAFAQRGVEERYTLPILWMTILAMLYLVEQTKKKTKLTNQHPRLIN